MKVMFLDAPSFGKGDMIEAFEKLGFTVELFWNENVYDRSNPVFENWCDEQFLNEDITFVFSFNYYSLISKCCQKRNLKYISHVYDCPHSALFSTTILNPCNYVFLFDKTMYVQLKNGGINTVYYLPMMANTERLDRLVVPENVRGTVSSDVSFVGSMYNEKNNLFDRLDNLDEYTRGYLEGVIESQLKIQGYSMVEELLTPQIIDAMYKALPYENPPDGVETLKYIYANYFINYKITSLERQRLLKAVSESYELKLYTHNKPETIPNAKFMGAIDWEESMPAVFKNSKINLNITLRSITSGMPLRAFDIMGAGGFLLTNYQQDFLDYFVPDEDYVYFTDEQDMLNKIEYYLAHEKERNSIARNGYEKVKAAHTYYHRAKEMVKVAKLN